MIPDHLPLTLLTHRDGRPRRISICRLITYWPARSILTHRPPRQDIIRQTYTVSTLTLTVITNAMRAWPVARSIFDAHCVREANELTNDIRLPFSLGFCQTSKTRCARARGWIFGQNVPSGRAQREQNAVLLA